MRNLLTLFTLSISTICFSQSDTLIFVSSSTIYFDNASSEIRADQSYKLDSVLSTINKTDRPKVTIHAHTDQVGDTTYNQMLSKDRANAIVEFLKLNNVKEDILETKFFGEDQLVNTNNNPDSLQQNRRAQLNIYSAKPTLWLIGKVIDKQTDSPLVARVFIHSKLWKKAVKSDSSGSFKFIVPKDKVIGINTTLPGYLNSSKMAKTSEPFLRKPLIIKLERGDGQWLEGQILSDSGAYVSNAKVQMNAHMWSDTAITDSLGDFRLFIPKEGTVSLDVIAKDHLIAMKSLEVTTALFLAPLEIKLPRLKEGKKFEIERIFFIGGRDFLLEKSFNVLPQLHAFMEINKNTCIRIDGHINGPNAPKTKVLEPDHDLSVARARRIYRFLLSKGINKDRMAYKGHGNWHMVYPKTRYEDEMQKNRRVEITIKNCEEIAIMENDSISPKTSLFTFVPQIYDTYISTQSNQPKLKKSRRLD